MHYMKIIMITWKYTTAVKLTYYPSKGNTGVVKIVSTLGNLYPIILNFIIGICCRYMGFKSDTRQKALPWKKLGDKMLLRQYIQTLHTEVKCSSSLILNTLTEISRAISYALDIKGKYIN